MAKKTFNVRSPWEDRWREPSLDELLKPYKENSKKVTDLFFKKMGEIDDTSWRIVWHGAAWRWTVEFVLGSAESDAGESGEDGVVLCYFVPRPEQPTISIPLTDEAIAALPMRRLNRYVRDGIRSSKRAVDLHWATWTPTAGAEIEYLIDLIQRKRKWLLAAAE